MVMKKFRIHCHESAARWVDVAAPSLDAVKLYYENADIDLYHQGSSGWDLDEFEELPDDTQGIDLTLDEDGEVMALRTPPPTHTTQEYQCPLCLTWGLVARQRTTRVYQFEFDNLPDEGEMLKGGSAFDDEFTCKKELKDKSECTDEWISCLDCYETILPEDITGWRDV